MHKNHSYQISLEAYRRINPTELADFLTSFEQIYNSIFLYLNRLERRSEFDFSTINFYEHDFHHRIIESINNIFREGKFNKIEWDGISDTRDRTRKMVNEFEGTIKFDSISMNSPLKFSGFATGFSIMVLSVAAAISGGRVQFDGNKFEIELPPIATAIWQIRAALNNPIRVTPVPIRKAINAP